MGLDDQNPTTGVGLVFEHAGFGTLLSHFHLFCKIGVLMLQILWNMFAVAVMGFEFKEFRWRLVRDINILKSVRIRCRKLVLSLYDIGTALSAIRYRSPKGVN